MSLKTVLWWMTVVLLLAASLFLLNKSNGASSEQFKLLLQMDESIRSNPELWEGITIDGVHPVLFHKQLGGFMYIATETAH